MPKVTNVEIPSWKDEPLEWCLWYLSENRHVYEAFRRAADSRFAQYPNARTSADAVMHHVRFTTPINAKGDMFKVNNNAVSLFVRIYLDERPQHKEKFQLRHSFLDDLTAAEKSVLLSVAVTPNP